MCREEALSLCETVASSRVRTCAVVKEVAASADADADLGVGDFGRKYFKCGDVFHDPDRAFVRHLGNRRVKVPLSKLLRPVSSWRDLKALGARLTEKGIDGNLKGEGLVQGGVLVIAADGEVTYTYKEEIGSEIPAAEIRAAVEALATR